MITYTQFASISLRVNGATREVIVRPADTLLHVLRQTLGLTGTKLGCENGDCGACTVLLDGKPVKSCMVLAVETEGAEITTIEGLSDTAVQKAFLQEAGYQCGFCTPGFIVNAYALLRAHPSPDPDTIRTWLDGNLCRCTGYEGIQKAIAAAKSSAAADVNRRKSV
jgi:carbon-monoxide dehydrogenase small subunit